MTNKNMGEQVPEICVILKEPGKEPRMEKIPNTLEAFQTAVGGRIEMVPGSWGFPVISNKEGAIVKVPPIWVICNEEGRLLGLPYCCTIGKADFVGPILLIGVTGEGFADIPITLEAARWLYSELWETC